MEQKETQIKTWLLQNWSNHLDANALPVAEQMAHFAIEKFHPELGLSDLAVVYPPSIEYEHSEPDRFRAEQAQFRAYTKALDQILNKSAYLYNPIHEWAAELTDFLAAWMPLT